MDVISASAAKLLGGFQSPSGRQGKLSILIYHRVLPHYDPLRPFEVDVGMFCWQMKILAQCFNVISLREAVLRLREGTLPQRAACITFDDGYADNLHLARPILARFGLPATVFVATGFLNGGRMWNDSVIEAVRLASGPIMQLDSLEMAPMRVTSVGERRHAVQAILKSLKYLDEPLRAKRTERLVESLAVNLPDDLMMTDADVRSLAQSGIEIGGHTVNHPILKSLMANEAKVEINNGRQYLEAVLQRDVTLFAYPNGRRGNDYVSAHVDLVRDLQFNAAVSTNIGVSRFGDSGFELRRFTPWDRTPRRFVARLLLNLRTFGEIAESASTDAAEIKG